MALEDEGFLLSIPFASLIVFAILAVMAGVLAAIPPARAGFAAERPGGPGVRMRGSGAGPRLRPDGRP